MAAPVRLGPPIPSNNCRHRHLFFINPPWPFRRQPLRNRAPPRERDFGIATALRSQRRRGTPPITHRLAVGRIAVTPPRAGVSLSNSIISSILHSLAPAFHAAGTAVAHSISPFRESTGGWSNADRLVTLKPHSDPAACPSPFARCRFPLATQPSFLRRQISHTRAFAPSGPVC